MRLRVSRKQAYMAVLTILSMFLITTTIFSNLELVALTPQNLVVYGPDTLYSQSEASVRVLVFNVMNHEPVGRADLTIKLRNQSQEVLLFTGRSDKLGTGDVKFDVPDVAEGSYEIVVEASSNLGRDVVRSPVKVVRDYKALLTTDKPIYKPGDEVQIRVLVLRLSDLKPIETETIIEVEDPKGNKVFKQFLSTNGFGVANTSLQLADELILGRYTVRAVVGEQEFEKKVEVKRYVLPKFKVDFSTEKEFYLPGEVLRGGVSANYFFGKPVSGDVRIKAYTYEIELKEVASMQGKLDGEGNFDFELDLPTYFVGLPLEQGKGALFFNVTVTDSADHSEKIVRSVPISSKVLLVDLIPEGSVIKPGLDNVIYVITYYPDGTPAKATVTINGKVVQTDEAGFGYFTVKPSTQGSYVVEITAVDSRGNEVELKKTLNVEAGKEHVRVVTDKVIYGVGDVAKLNVFYVGNKTTDTVYIDVIKGKQTIITKAIKLTNSDASFDLPITQDMAGVIEVHAYKILPSEDIIRDSRKLFVNLENDLLVNIELDKDQYRPGEEARINFAIRATGGDPRLATIGLNIVDESVFALEEMQPGFEKLYFLLESELMKPRYEIHGYTFPEVYQNVTEGRVQSVASIVMAGGGDVSYGIKQFSYTLKEQSISEMKNAYFSALSSVAFVITVPLQAFGLLLFSPLFILAPMALLPYVLIGMLVYCVKGKKFTKGLVVTVVMVLLFGGMWSLAASVGLRPGGDLVGVRSDWAAVQAERGGLFPAITTATPTPPPAVPFLEEGPSAKQAGREQPRLRQFFPETLYSNPLIITDEQGRATITIPLADSITTWRATALASSLLGEIGANTKAILVFQDFFVDLDLPIALTQNDEVSVPVAIYNYLNKTQSVFLELRVEDWFQLMGNSTQTIEIGPNEVGVAHFRIKVERIGLHRLTVYAYGTELSDAISRRIEVLPDGQEIRHSNSDRIKGRVEETIIIPEVSIDNASKIFVKIYPGVFSQVVEGLDSMLRMPFGCFEQTSSITYPNVLVLDYMIRTNKITPEIQMKAEGYINVGYQRLIGFEVEGGGFDWFGQPPAKLILTAYGLMEFYDMAKVHYVDPAVIERIQNFVASQQNPDGSFEPEGALHESYRTENRLMATAYVAWSLAETEYEGDALTKAINYIKKGLDVKTVNDTYTLALLANAFVTAGDDKGKDVLDELYERRVEVNDTIYWESSHEYGYRTFAGATGPTKDIETTALATLAFLKAEYRPKVVQKALNFIIRSKDSYGSWGSTQATIYSLKALLLSQEKQMASANATVDIWINGVKAKSLRIDETNEDVLHLIDLRAQTVEGSNTVAIEMKGEGNLYYQIVSVYYTPWKLLPPILEKEISIDVTYNTTSLRVNDMAEAKVRIEYKGEGSADMVVIDLGIPPGFSVLWEDLEKLVGKQFDRIDIRGRQIIIYMEKLEGVVEFSYRLRADMPIVVKTPSSQVYKYYDPNVKDVELPIEMTVV